MHGKNIESKYKEKKIMPFKNPNDLANSFSKTKLKPRDDAYNKTMNDFLAKRKSLLDSDKYLEPEWDNLTKQMQEFRGGYEKPQLYSLREYLLDNSPDEFQIDKVRDDIDFKGIWDLMQKGGDFYHDASVDGNGFDSDVREKLFNGMSDSLGLDYDDIYYKWLGRKKPTVTKTPAYTLDNRNPKKGDGAWGDKNNIYEPANKELRTVEDMISRLSPEDKQYILNILAGKK